MARTASSYRDSNSTADRALTILNLFNEQRLTLSAADVADELDVARSTGYRYLQSLVASNFLEEAPGGGFRLGTRLLELARLARRGYGFGELATPIMASLAERFHQTVLLTRRAGASIVCIERQESEAQYVRLSYERGTVLPINAGASAVVLLAWLPEDQVRALLSQAPLHSFTPNTLVDPEDIVKRLATIRDAGYAITQGEVDPDVLGVAVPVRGRDARVEAGLSFVIMKNRFSGDIDELVGALLEAARKLGELVELAA